MSDTPKYISKVEIKGLWGRFDLEWNLNEDVNILSGANGSGKSTILNCVYAITSTNNGFNGNRFLFLTEFGNILDACKIYFNSNDYIISEFIRTDNVARKNEFFEENKSLIGNNIYKQAGCITGSSESLHEVLQRETLLPVDHPSVDIISTFDTELKEAEGIQKLSDEKVKTELDWEISQLQNKYLSYQIDIGKRAFDAISNNDTNGKVIKIRATQERFLAIIDVLFRSTGKRINRTENKISFLSGEEKISAYQLSSGEKQLLIILLTVLVQDNKQAILFMDEPEISLHIDWQKKLIQYIRELNPNVQIILATHSPAIIREGWLDRVSNVSDLINLHKSNK